MQNLSDMLLNKQYDLFHILMEKNRANSGQIVSNQHMISLSILESEWLAVKKKKSYTMYNFQWLKKSMQSEMHISKRCVFQVQFI